MTSLLQQHSSRKSRSTDNCLVSVKRSDDADDAVAYAWAVTEKTKRGDDADDAVAYAWAVTEKTKRSEDADDAVAYAWAVIEAKS